MAKTVFTAKGIAVEIGQELGHGGEASIFEIPSRRAQVAKIYHKPPDAKKQAKLSLMPEMADQQLLNYIAWPQETLHASPSGAVVGFLMPMVAGKKPIHMVYSPAHRRQENPKAAWDFLLCVARNIATSFETVHAHGHVIGDVNETSVMVGKDSKVVLVDSDSFQVNAHGTLYLCEVGVPIFTPPELQSLSSFHGFTRTTNHDNFGLALLIFHVLFGGRHPYSGVPLKSGVGDALQTDIKNFRYAYARDGQSRGIAPPPRSIPVSMLPDHVEAMFHRAFTERGTQAARPSAQQWVAALDGIRGKLKKCSASAMHVYPDHLAQCPWCALEKQGVVYFIDLGATYTPTSTGFVLTQAWAAIQAVPAPPALNIPSPSSFAVTAKPLPSNVPGDGTIVFYRLLAICLGIVVAAAAPQAIFLGVLVGVVGWFMASGAGSSERNAERSRRASSRQAAKQAYDQLVARAKRDAGQDGFQAKRTELAKLRDEYQALPQTEKLELNKLHSTAQERQKQRFLDTCFIDSATISGVGPTRKAALRSFGIETAADVTRNRVMQVRGFGASLTQAVIDWKASCERRFVFNAANAVSPTDLNAVRVKFGTRKVAIEAALVRGPTDLQSLRQRVTAQTAVLQSQLEEAAKGLAQAEKDMTLL